MRKPLHLSLIGGVLGIALSVISPPLTHGQEQKAFEAVGMPGNTPDTNGYGSVSYAFNIRKNRVSNAEYARFLNTADPDAQNERALYHPKMEASDTGGIIQRKNQPAGKRYTVKEGFGNKAVAYVSWQNAARFMNWLQNGANKEASTEFGAYDMAKAKDGYVERSPGAQYWIPSRNELYKASFFREGEKPGYVRKPQIPEPVAEGFLKEIVDYTDSDPQNLPPVAEATDAPPPVASFEPEEPDATAVEEDGFRVAFCAPPKEEPEACAAQEEECAEPEEVAEGVVPGSTAPAYFMTSPFINPGGPVREVITEPTPEPSPTPAS